MLTWKRLRAANVERNAQSFPDCKVWPPSDWCVALVGEVGEAANEVKKYWRDPSRSVQRIGLELADVVVYLDLLLMSQGLPALDGPVFHRLGGSPVGDNVLCMGGAAGELCQECFNRAAGEVVEVKVLRVAATVCAVATSLGLDLDQCVIEKFNQVSDRVGSTVRLAA